MASILLSHQPDKVHNSGVVVNPHKPPPHVTLLHDVSDHVELSPSSGSVGFSNTNCIFKIPKEGYLQEMCLDLTYTESTAGGTFPNASWYLSAVNKVEFRVGSTTVYRIENYREFINYALQKMPEAKRANFYGLGNTDATNDGDNLLCPIWSPWSRMLNDDEGLPSFPCFAVDGDIELIVDFTSIADLEASGTVDDALTGQLLLERALVADFDRKMAWTMKSVDVQSGPARTGYTSSSTRNSESFISGSLQELFIYLTTDTVQTNLDYITTEIPADLQIYHSGTLVRDFSSDNAIKFHMMKYGFEENNQTAGGDCALISFSSHGKASNAGSGFKVSRGTVEVALVASAAAYGRVYGIVSATYAIKDGRLIKMI